MSYYIVSLKHTHKKDKFITLWRPDNKGYCWPIAAAGIYTEVEDGYHNDGENVPVPVDSVQKFLKEDEDGRLCLPLNKQVLAHIRKFQKPD
jgi:hypothetical protein